MNRPFPKFWKGFVERASNGETREHYLSRTLNIVLLILLVWGIGFEIQHRIDYETLDTTDGVVFALLAILGLSYVLNHRGKFRAATLLTLCLLIASTFALAFVQHWRGSNNFSVLYYLIVAVLMSELFFSMRGYLITVTIIMAGLLSISLLNPGAQPVFILLFIFSVLIGFSSYNRRLIEREQLAMAQKLAHEQSRLSLEQRKSAHLGLLGEVGRQVINSLDEKEILERTLEIVVARFGYAEATISLLVDDDILEVAAISGTQDFGYHPGFQQKMGQGIIGHVAETRETYLTGDVSKDPYYFCSVEMNGSAIGVPMLDKENLLGVIYVESVTQDELQADDVQTLQTLANQVATALQKARLYARTQQHLQVMTTLQSISHTVASSLDPDEILNNVIRSLKDSFGYTYLSIYLLEEDILYLGAQLGYPDTQLLYEIPIHTGVMGRTARNQETQFVRDVSTDSDFLPADYEVKNEIAVPLIKDDKVLGVLNVESKGDPPLSEHDVNLLNTLAGSVAVAIDNARLHAEVKLMAMTDVVSGLPNRRAFDETLYAEITRASRYSQPISLIILDLDSFKEFNDKWGHPAGDVRLREIADLLRANVRDPDMTARYGGEEFAIILPNTSKGGAIRLAERLRQSARSSAPQKSNEYDPIPGYTISLGVATYPDDATSMEELLLMADNAELMAKRLGKNQVYAANSANKIQRS